MKRKPRPTQLIITARLIYEPNHELVWDRRTYYTSRPLCFGKLLCTKHYKECPPDLHDEWMTIVEWHAQQTLAKMFGKEK